VSEDFLREVVLHPKHGYGAAMNPCIDCRIFMLRKAGEIARRQRFDVVFTGEVVGQRPMSQIRSSLERIEKESGLEGMLLRPLSARHLPPTDVERQGRLDRNRLGAFHGRSRREQFRMAGEMGVEEWPTPGGGCCFLADRNFARRLRDLVSHGRAEAIGPGDIVALKVGRHFRIGYDVKVAYGRDEAESTFLKSYAGDTRWTCHVTDGRGSLGVVYGEPGDERAGQVAGIAARYSRHRAEPQVEVRLRRGSEERILTVPPASEADLAKWLI
jgi:hypothetical protein